MYIFLKFPVRRNLSFIYYTKVVNVFSFSQLQSIKSYMRKTDTSFNRQFVKSLANISFEGIKENAGKLLPAFLDSSATNTVVVCSPAALEDVIEGFKQFDIELTTWETLEDSFLTQD